MHRVLIHVIARVVLAIFAAAASAQGYPSKPIRFIVASPPGGSPDILARIVSNKLSEQMRTQVVADNRPGASGVIGVEIAKAAAPDGYTLLLVTSTTFAALPVLGKNIPYDPDRDFVSLSRIARVANVVTVNSGIGVNSVADLVKLAKAKPESLNYGSAGNGSPGHLAGVMFNVLAGVKTTHIPYKGAALAVTDVIGGHIQFLITSPLVAMPHGRAGRIKVLATTGSQRDLLLPELPTVADTIPGYEIEQWWGVAAPKGTPSAISQRLHKELVAALNAPDVKAQMNKNGASPISDSPAEFAAFMKAERVRIAKIGKEAKIQLD